MNRTAAQRVGELAASTNMTRKRGDQCAGNMLGQQGGICRRLVVPWFLLWHRAGVAWLLNGEVWRSLHHGMPFGASSSVYAWHRVGALLAAIGRKILFLALLRYVDDYFAIDKLPVRWCFFSHAPMPPLVHAGQNASSTPWIALYASSAPSWGRRQLLTGNACLERGW